MDKVCGDTVSESHKQYVLNYELYKTDLCIDYLKANT